MLALGLAKQAAVALPAELAAQAEARERSATEAHLVMQLFRKTMEILMHHATAAAAAGAVRARGTPGPRRANDLCRPTAGAGTSCAAFGSPAPN